MKDRIVEHFIKKNYVAGIKSKWRCKSLLKWKYKENHMPLCNNRQISQSDNGAGGDVVQAAPGLCHRFTRFVVSYHDSSQPWTMFTSCCTRFPSYSSLLVFSSLFVKPYITPAVFCLFSDLRFRSKRENNSHPRSLVAAWHWHSPWSVWI